MLGGASLPAAPSHEERAYAAAAALFTDGIYDQAETALAQFVGKYADSPQVPMAVLLEAQAQYKQGKFTAAINLLSATNAAPGGLADRYAYWLGEAQFGRGDFDHAVETFTNLANRFPDSTLRLSAVVEAAAALARTGETRDKMLMYVLAPTDPAEVIELSECEQRRGDAGEQHDQA
mgnify:CR=1 FL=1